MPWATLIQNFYCILLKKNHSTNHHPPRSGAHDMQVANCCSASRCEAGTDMHQRGSRLPSSRQMGTRRITPRVQASDYSNGTGSVIAPAAGSQQVAAASTQMKQEDQDLPSPRNAFVTGQEAESRRQLFNRISSVYDEVCNATSSALRSTSCTLSKGLRGKRHLVNSCVLHILHLAVTGFLLLQNLL